MSLTKIAQAAYDAQKMVGEKIEEHNQRATTVSQKLVTLHASFKKKLDEINADHHANIARENDRHSLALVETYNAFEAEMGAIGQDVFNTVNSVNNTLIEVFGTPEQKP